jgi:hypothetical protein
MAEEVALIDSGTTENFIDQETCYDSTPIFPLFLLT